LTGAHSCCKQRKKGAASAKPTLSQGTYGKGVRSKNGDQKKTNHEEEEANSDVSLWAPAKITRQGGLRGCVQMTLDEKLEKRGDSKSRRHGAMAGISMEKMKLAGANTRGGKNEKGLAGEGSSGSAPN